MLFNVPGAKSSLFSMSKISFTFIWQGYLENMNAVYYCRLSNFIMKRTMPDTTPSYYQHHVFFCLNQREGKDRPCCANCGAQLAQQHAKQRIKKLNLSGPGKVRINQAGCLDRCEEGPVLVVYPQETWYTYVDTEDIDEIIDSHLVGGKVVDRLRI
jgi:(2Fe-2S) ferredoxin